MNLTLRSKYNFAQIIQLIVLFLISLNVANLYFYLIFVAFFICLFVNFRHLKVDIVFTFLMLFSFTYIIFYPSSRDSYTTVLKQFAYPMCYLIGVNLFDESRAKTRTNKSVDDHIKQSILVVSIGTFVHYILNAVINFDSLMRNTIDFWTGEVMSATGQALLVIMAMSIFSIWLVMDCQLWKKGVSLFGLVVIFAYNFVLAGRTILILEVFILLVAFIYTQVNTHTLGRIRSYIFFAFVLVGVFVIFINNIFGVQDWILSSNLAARFNTASALEDIRFERKWIYISRMLDYPFGGGVMRTEIGGYAHELYLDIYSDVGIIGYILVVAVMIIFAINVFKLIKSDKLSLETKGLLLCVFLGTNIVFFLEPIIQGSPWLFCIYCFLNGVILKKKLVLLK